MGSHFPLKVGKSPHGNRRKQPEAVIQRAICDYIAAVAPTVIVYAVPNASRRTEGGRASNAVPGLRKGVFDLALVLPPGAVSLALGSGPTPAFIEVKTETGKLSADQTAFRGALHQMGVPHVIATSIDDVRTAFAEWGVPTREYTGRETARC